MSNIPLTDLRIGNLVKSRPESLVSYAEVIAIENRHYDNTEECIKVKFDMFGNANSEGWIVQKDIEGIPISEELLERFGFYRKVNNSTQWFHKSLHNGISFYMHFGFSITIDSYGAGDIERDITPGLKYVHQLMNTFYFLTGTELTLKQ